MIDDETDVPSVARIYDYLLGGAQNFQVDRDRARELTAAYPNIGPVCRANRSFLRHAAEHALGLGITQFLDLGSGIPTKGNVHEVAHRIDPAARVSYVDNEPVAVARSRQVLADVETATITDADVRDVDAVLGAPGVARHLDLGRPVALLAVAILHFLGDDDDPRALIGRYAEALAPGSLLALTHTSTDFPEHPEVVRANEQIVTLYATTSNPVRARSRATIADIATSAGFRIGGDGLVDVSRWGTPADGGPLGCYALITEPIQEGTEVVDVTLDHRRMGGVDPFDGGTPAESPGRTEPAG